MSSEPAAFADAHEGDTVDLTIASGRVDLPDLVGKTEDQARDLLNSLGLIVSRTSEISDEIEGRSSGRTPARENRSRRHRLDRRRPLAAGHRDHDDHDHALDQ